MSRSAATRRRPPRPTRQQIAAAATRREILDAARRLFAQRGYVRTSVADIADEAGVSIPTIYASVGPKPAIVQVLLDLIDWSVAGEDARANVLEQTDPAAILAIGPRINRALEERYGDIIAAVRAAASAEPDLAALEERGQELHRTGARNAAARLAELGALRNVGSVDEAADVIAVLADIELIGRLVHVHGWTFDRAEQWVTTALQTLLLRPAEPKPGGPSEQGRRPAR